MMSRIPKMIIANGHTLTFGEIRFVNQVRLLHEVYNTCEQNDDAYSDTHDCAASWDAEALIFHSPIWFAASAASPALVFDPLSPWFSNSVQ